MSYAFPFVIIMSRKCTVELLSCSGPTFKPTFMTGVSDAAGFFVPFVTFLSNWPMYDSMTGSQDFPCTHRRCVQLVRLSPAHFGGDQPCRLGRQGLSVLLCIHPCSTPGDNVRFQLADAVCDLHRLCCHFFHC